MIPKFPNCCELFESGKQVGVGTSRLQEDMVKDGYLSILSMDYSKVAIEHMREVHKSYPELTYQVADSRYGLSYICALF